MPVPTLNLSALPAPWGRRDARDLDTGGHADLDFADQRFSRTGVRHTARDVTHVRLAREALNHLPAADETIHLIVSGRFPLAALIPAVLDLAPGATVEEIQISTLSFSKVNGSELVKWIDAGRVRGVTLIAAEVFATRNPAVYDTVAEQLRERGHHVAQCRTHAKIINLRLSDGRTFTAEASANLRSAKSIENVTVSSDPGLYAFHRQWITSMRDGDRDRK